MLWSGWLSSSCTATPHIRLIPQGTVDNNLGPDRFAGPKALNRFLLLQATNHLIARPLSGSPNCAWYWVAPVWGQGIPPYSYYQYRTSDIAAVGKKITSLAMTRFGPRHSPYLFYWYRTSDIAAVGTHINVFS